MSKPYPPPIFSAAAARMPGLLSIQRFLLLALLALMPALALAQVTWSNGGGVLPNNWSERINEGPFGTINLFDVHRNSSEVGTGLKLSHSTNCSISGSQYWLQHKNNSGGTSNVALFKFIRNGDTSTTDLDRVTLASPTSQYATLSFKANQAFTGETTLEMQVSLSSVCDRYGTQRRGQFTIKLLAQRNIRTAESLVAAGAFRTDRLLASSTAVTTGIVFQRGTMRCPTNMTLLNHADYLRLQHLTPSSKALTGALATAHSAVAMGGTNARALALLFKAGATVTAGVLTVSLKVDSPASNNACPAAFAQTITAKVTAAASLAWTTDGDDVTVASSTFNTPLSSSTPTGIRIARYAGTCEMMKVVLPDNQVTGANNARARVRDIMQLRSVNDANDTPVLGSPGFNITVDDINLDDIYARLELRGSPPAGTLRVTAEVSPGCAAAVGLAETQTLSYLVTVIGNAWEVEGKDSASTTLSFAAPALAAAGTPTPTGIRLHRSSANCRVFDVTMKSGAGNWLGLLRMRVSGGTTTSVAALGREFSNVHMQDGNAADNHFRLVFSARANVGATTRVERATVEVSPSSTCAASTRPANPLTLTYMVSIRASYREVGSNETLQADWAPPIEILQAAPTVMSTGIQFQRGLASCPNTSMSLINHTRYLRLQPVDASGNPSGSAAVSHNNVPMFSGIAANNRALALLFAPRSNVATGTVTVRVRVASDTSGAGCTGLQASTITASVTLVNWTTWVAGPKARSQAASVLLLTEIGTGADTGIRFNHAPLICDDSRLVLSGTTVTGSTGTARARSIARFSGYFSALTGPDARSTSQVGFDITASNNQTGGYARLEMIGTPPVGTLTLQAVATPICPPEDFVVGTLTLSNQSLKPLTLSYTVTLADPKAWQAGSKSRNQASSVIVAADIGAGADTGIRFHSFTAACDRTRLVLTDDTVTVAGVSAQVRTIARLQRFTASDAKDGAAGPELNLASLKSGVHAGLELMGTPPAGTLTLQAVATAACPSVTGIKTLTLSYTVTLAGPLDWQAGSKSRGSAASVIVAADIGAGADTGIRFHSFTAACDRTRLVLTDRAVTDASTAQAREIARLQRYNASDAKDGSPGPELDLTSLKSGVHAGLELMGTPPVGTLTFEAVATASCPSVTGIKPLTLSYQVTVTSAIVPTVSAAQSVQATVGQATGAAATRVIGLSAIAAVMGRAAGDDQEGQSLLGMLAAKEELLESGDIDLRSFLAGQEFALGLDAAATGRPGFGVWGRAEFLQLEAGEDSDPLRHEGAMFSAQLGADYRTAGGALVGLSYGQHLLDTDYAGSLTGADAYAGNYVLKLDVAQPYAALPLEGGHLAGAVAVGKGEAEFKDADSEEIAAYDADYLGWALGYRAPVGDGGMEVEGAVSGGSLDIPDLGADGSKSDNMSLRTGLRYAPSIDMGRGSLKPSAGVALAVDWGDDPGHKYELSAGLGYVGARLAAAAEYIYIGMDEGDLTASGGSIDVRFSTAAGNLGLGLAATPAHGPASGDDLLPDQDTGMRGSAEIGYGLAVDGGVLTPYGGWSFATEAGEAGLRLRQGDGGSWLLRWREDERDMIAIEFSLLGD